MNLIVEKENSQINIDRLDAQRYLYTKAKCISIISFILCAIIPMALVFLRFCFYDNDIFSKIVIIYSFCAIFIEKILEFLITKRRNTASRIQQLFDCELFDLPWNEPLCGEQPTHEEIYKAKTGKSINKLHNWYEPVIESLKHEYAIVVCMHTNVLYDRNIRNIYHKIIYITMLVLPLIVFLFGIINNNDMLDWLTNSLIPFTPLMAWCLDIHKHNIENLKALTRIEKLINITFSKVKKKGKIAIKELSVIQDLIFVHRNTAYPIPNILYKIMRNRLEKTTNYSINQICEEIAKS